MGSSLTATGSFDWAFPGAEVHAFVNELERPVGTYLYGRRMYEIMRFWADVPDVQNEPARSWSSSPTSGNGRREGRLLHDAGRGRHQPHESRAGLRPPRDRPAEGAPSRDPTSALVDRTLRRMRLPRGWSTSCTSSWRPSWSAQVDTSSRATIASISTSWRSGGSATAWCICSTPFVSGAERERRVRRSRARSTQRAVGRWATP